MAEDKEPDSTDESNPSPADEPTPESTDPESTDAEPTDEELAAAGERVPDDEPVEDDGPTGEDDSAEEKVPAMAGATSRGPRKKDAPTPKQSGGRSDKRKRTTPVKFVGESVEELRKVVYPTGTQLRGYFVVVLVFVCFIIAFVSLLDLAFGWAILQVFGA